MEISLVDVSVGKKAEIKRIGGGLAFQRRLSCLNIRIGKRIRKIASQPLRGPVVIEIDGERITLGRGMAMKIIVEVIE
jgi:ferrous iron transport protein A